MEHNHCQFTGQSLVVPLSCARFLLSSMDRKSLIFLELLLLVPQQRKQMSLKLIPYLTIGLVQPYLLFCAPLSRFRGRQG